MCSPGELEEAGVTPGMLRLSLGLEQVREGGGGSPPQVQDILEDLEQALQVASQES